ncbi:glycosyltransferase [Flavobacterium sp. NST-5]|uniref:Glycosyltransferase n=1 Tax=Flavobacterium ichthyis TaxID=2698827 RepID=A0ABW9ZA63_9FLAO|nr:glycosyltransferase [Flavobacterium ichthyis]NBL65777.1 glycosyltransferase [Flavobacterium ichthyis]
MQETAIIIPCYNEENRLNSGLIAEFFKISDVDIFLVNDGSTDQTLPILQNISSQNPERCFVISLEKNRGKANAVFQAVQQILAKQYRFIGYFDADFSTPITQFELLLEQIKKPEIQLAFASRILTLNSGIERKSYRHFFGRIITTIINFKHQLDIYDTQCGAKIFNQNTARIAFEKPFKTKWLFDVEIFIRLKRHNLLHHAIEVPIQNWKDVSGSKLGLKNVFGIAREIFLIWRI